ncbi:MAG TPA: TonB-dependent receptor [Candidatus Angelobacter sp.]|nr:TonB-dependent receptor [Candidatus Angelobacter sp.]
MRDNANQLILFDFAERALIFSGPPGITSARVYLYFLILGFSKQLQHTKMPILMGDIQLCEQIHPPKFFTSANRGISMQRFAAVFCLLCILSAVLKAQSTSGELHIQVVDPGGASLAASGELVSKGADFSRQLTIGKDGRYIAKGLPFGLYELHLQHAGFSPFREAIEIRSAVPLEFRASLNLATLETKVLVTPDTLLDPHNTGNTVRLGEDTLNEHVVTQPARDMFNVVQEQPGWVLNGNSVLYPRETEFATQFVVDGIPLRDNRAPVFAPAMDVDDVQSVNIFTANFPAEFGRRMGGVIEVTSARDPRQGFHGKAILGGGSFDTETGYLNTQYLQRHSTFGLSLSGSHTDRYLDPAAIQNFTNKATNSGIRGRFEQDFSDWDRLTLSIQQDRSVFQIPNELLQQEAGQRQDRANKETRGQFSWQHIFSQSIVGQVNGMGRDIAAGLQSNDLSTPILPSQQRGLRESYFNASVAGDQGIHKWKVGADAGFASVSERFGYQITDPARFDQDILPNFSFFDRRQLREQGAFAQDEIHLGRFTASAGVRWDHYQLLVDETAWSPRLGAAWNWPSLGLVLHASYDRTFEPPQIENLLLTSSPIVDGLRRNVVRLPVPSAHGNYYQAGFDKSIEGKVLLSGNWFRRDFRNYADDDLLLNTGLVFPIAFSSATIQGFEAKVEMLKVGPFSGFVAYSNTVGVEELPITGGLFLDPDAANLLASTDHFTPSQDQRNTVHGRVRFQPWSRLWFGTGTSYGSGLPVELTDLPSAADQIDSRILDRVNFSRGRVRPRFALDFSVGTTLWKQEARSLRIQADVTNVTNRLNVINFAGLFSGTALAPPRAFAIRSEINF